MSPERTLYSPGRAGEVGIFLTVKLFPAAFALAKADSGCGKGCTVFAFLCQAFVCGSGPLSLVKSGWVYGLQWPIQPCLTADMYAALKEEELGSGAVVLFFPIVYLILIFPLFLLNLVDP